MNALLIVIVTVHVIAALGIIGLVLLQHGKGADMGAAFGSGASGSLFGASGSANFLSRATAVLALVFFLTSLSLTYLATHKTADNGGGVMDSIKADSAKMESSKADNPKTEPAPANTAVPAPMPQPAAPASKSSESPK
jgi:preprotein translocase subunit SecG